MREEEGNDFRGIVTILTSHLSKAWRPLRFMDNNTASDAVASDAVSTVEQPATKKAKVDSGIPERKSANSESETASDAVTAAETIASAAIAHAGEAGQSASEDKKRAEESSEFEVINWEDALEQCSADEEFLRELLGDLRDEVLENTNKIQSAVGAQEEVRTLSPLA